MTATMGKVIYPRTGWEYHGHAGHLIVASQCRFHLATKVGPWWVSTVGEWLPDSASWDIFARRVPGGIPPTLRGDERRAWFLEHVGFIEIGAGRKYETMVFEIDGDKRCHCGCGAPVIKSLSELDSDGYNEALDAGEGHHSMCERWSRRPAGSGAIWDDGE